MQRFTARVFPADLNGATKNVFFPESFDSGTGGWRRSADDHRM
jgi:hypothetical protein